MRVLLLSYAIIPAFAEAFDSNKYTSSAGWIVGIHNGLVSNGINVAIASPSTTNGLMKKKDNGLTTFYSFHSNSRDMAIMNTDHIGFFRDIIIDFKPTVIVIFGTEYTQGQAMLVAAKEEGLLNSTVIFTQGLISLIERYYYADLPIGIIQHASFREHFNKMDISSQRKSFIRRGKNEIEMICQAKHIIGGTVWDKTVIHSINPQIHYHYCPEILREGFYNNKWDISKIERHSIFSVASGFYPVKGIHYLIEGFSEIKKKYEDSKLYITVSKPRKASSIKEKMYSLTYEQYICSLLDKYGLWDSVSFLGVLREDELIQRYLRSHVFICPSSIENHSQTVSEAKALGVPVIAAFVGGVVERIDHGEDGYLYQHNAPYMIAEYVSRFFESDSETLVISEKERENSHKLLDKNQNIQTMIAIFKEIEKN